MMNEPETIGKILGMKTVAIVGLSDKKERPSFRVASYLKMQGYRVVPVNPSVQMWMGEKSYPSLETVPFKIDVVNIFQKSEKVPPIVASAIELGAKAVWMQEGVISPAAASEAEEAGLLVVMDRCLMREHAGRALGDRL